MKKALEVLIQIDNVKAIFEPKGNRGKIKVINHPNKEKERILKENDSPELRFLLETALNPYLTYGVKKISPVQSSNDVPSFDQLKSLRDKLASRELTGNAAIRETDTKLGCDKPLMFGMLVRVFQKDLKIGISTKTVNKIFPNLIPTFIVGLCDKYEEEEIRPGLYFAEFKLDGLRCITIIDEKGEVTFYSRNGKELHNLHHIKKELKGLTIRNVVLDGELYAKDWNETMKIVSSLEEKDASNLKYYLWDAIPLQDWKKKECALPYEVRKYNVRVIVKDLLTKEGKDKYIIVVNEIELNSYAEAKETLKLMLEEGYEGSVLKKARSFYPFGRSRDWLKWKPYYTYDIEVIGTEEGRGRQKGRLGAFICSYKGKTVNVGSGLSDEARETYWKEREGLIGKIIEVKVQEITKDGSLRFPVFVRMREDKS